MKWFSTSADALESSYIISGNYYYIKNVNSGKYLTVSTDVANDGDNVYQYRYEGTARQRWKLTYNSSPGTFSGFYRITSAVAANKCLSTVSAQSTNGINIVVKYIDPDVKQFFRITDNDNFSHAIYTNGSNCMKIVAVQGGSCSDTANVYQSTYNQTGSDQWLIEPATGYNATYAAQYALDNYDDHLKTYPNCENLRGDCANFVSQCLAAGGYHYQGNWNVNKINNVNPAPSNTTELDDSWELSDPSSWISAKYFKYYWQQHVSYNDFTVNDILQSQATSSTNYVKGDVVQILEYNFGWGYVGVHTMIISQQPSNFNDKANYKVSYHSSPSYNKLLSTVLNHYVNGDYKVRFYNFT